MVTQRFVSFYESEPSPSLSVIVHNGEELSVSSMSLNRPLLTHPTMRHSDPAPALPTRDGRNGSESGQDGAGAKSSLPVTKS